MIPRTLPRRAFIKGTAACALTAQLPAIPGGAPSVEDVRFAVDQAHDEVWRRFVDKRFDVLLHYAGRDGEVVLPTAEECDECQPNGMSWSTPIEDGPFFGGLFLDGLCNRWHARRDEESANAARRIAAGLMKLADLGGTPGFIPRGIAADGRTHYPASSEDQVFPWFFGLWSYLCAGLAGAAQRSRIQSKLRETVLALESHGWQVPCARPGFGYRGAYLRPTAHDAARLLFLVRAMHRLTGEPRWLAEYRTRLAERLGTKGLSRAEICAEGVDFDGKPGKPSRIWTHSMSQAALRALAEAEDEPETAAAFRRGLLAGAQRAIPHLDRAQHHDRNNDLRFDVDWRFLMTSWKPQHTCDEAIALGQSQLPLWARHNPRSPWEDDTMREPLFAAWIVTLANDPTLLKPSGPRIREMLLRYDWSSLYTAAFFVAVNIQHESSRPPGF